MNKIKKALFLLQAAFLEKPTPRAATKNVVRIEESFLACFLHYFLSPVGYWTNFKCICWFFTAWGRYKNCLHPR